MTKMTNEIDYLDNNFHRMKASAIIERISTLRRNIIFLQTALRPQRGIFSIFENQLADQEKLELDVYWGDIGDYLGKLIDTAEDSQELIEGLYSSIDTLLTFRTNNIMKTLTLFSVIMMPLSLITGFFGMNIKLPFQEWLPQSFAAVGVISTIMIVIAVAMIIYFRVRKF
jgi:magnesium transporter